jgi:hypothetical protein
MKLLAAIILFFCIVTPIPAPAGSPFDGTWKVIRERSSNIDYYQSLTTDLSVQKDRVTIVRTYGPRRGLVERMTVKPDGSVARVPIGDPTFATNLFMGLKLAEGMTKDVTVTFSGDTTLVLTETFDVLASQGTKRMRVTSRYQLSDHNTLLTCLIERDARTGHAALRFVFKRADQNNAYVYTMADDWEINGKLPEQACLISIQGIVNEQQPVLYFTFGPQFPFNYTEDLRSFLEQERHFTFTTLRSLEQALTVFKDRLSGYIVWDKNERTSLIVAYTLAGLEKGIVITEEMIPLAERYGLKKIDDFRNRFNGWPDHKIYRWAKEQYWSRCSKDVIIWLGGVHGSALMPNVADHGITQKVFFTDLSARATDTLELALTRELLADMKPLGSVMGWHSYKKDREEEWVTVTSGYGLTVDGLNTLPNTSFLRNVPASPGFVFRNHHNTVPGKTYVPEKKVYIALVQTDGLGIGAWVKPGRGSIPYAWEVSMNFHWLSPAMQEFYYAQATPNDYFIGCLSGSAYMYPKAFPKKWLPMEIAKAKRFMDTLDLKVFEIMDYSADGIEAGENNLTKEIVDAYYTGMPDAIGFLNGYFASHTFTVRDKKPFISYDYYLSAEKPEEEAANDLKELAGINADRPYFLLVHVRENSDVARVKSICDRLGSGFEIVPLDVFLKMAGEQPTFKERFLKRK